MIRRFICACLVVLVSLPAFAADRFDQLRDSIRSQMVAQQAPSITVGVAKDGKIIWEESFGWADRERRIPATPNTMYSLASISKTMTGTALMTLVQAGKVDLDRPINDYLKDAQLQARIGDVREATVRRVANHTSGLPEYYQEFYENEPWPPPSPAETIRRFGWLMSPPGEKFEYSNLGYGILSHLIEQLSGKSYADYMREAVFLPLGMNRSSVEVDPAMWDFRAVRYGIDGLPVPPYVTDHPGASDIYSSAHDLLLFGMFQSKQHLSEQLPILSDSNIDSMQQPTKDEGGGKGYGVGWETIHRNNITMLNHTGGMTGVQTELRIVPSEHLVVVVLCNAEVWDLPTNIADEIMASLLPQWKPSEDAQHAAITSPPLPAAMVGVWKGKVVTYERDLPMTLTVTSTGEVHIKLGEHLESLVTHPRLTQDGYLRGILNGSLTIKDGVRRPYVLTIGLKLRDAKTLSGEIVAHADDRGIAPTNGLYPAVNGYPRPDRIQTDAFKFAQWAEVTKQP
jgi:CubicO group peptidase (beta-lactamase class C family)